MLGEGVQCPKGNCVALAGQCSLAVVPSSKQGVGRAPNTPPPPCGAGCLAGTQGHCLPLASRHGDGLGRASPCTAPDSCFLEDAPGVSLPW